MLHADWCLQTNAVPVSPSLGAIRCVGNDVFNQCGFQELGDRCTNRTLGKFCHWHNPSGMFNETQHVTANLLMH